VKLTRTQARMVRAVLRHPTTSFVSISAAIGLDPAVDFRGADLRDIDFGDDDLSGFDFSGADLRGADLSHALGIDQMISDATTQWSERTPQSRELAMPKTQGFARAHRDDESQRTDKNLLTEKRRHIISAICKISGTAYVRSHGVYFWDTTHDKRVICTISKRYLSPSQPYWFGYFPKWHEFLMTGDGLLILGCMDLSNAFAIPAVEIAPILSKLNVTLKEDDLAYWHLRMAEPRPGSYALSIPNYGAFSLAKFQFPLV
jgi:uncharacterized protein YjbI with pentapeptide repeats